MVSSCVTILFSCVKKTIMAVCIFKWQLIVSVAGSFFIRFFIFSCPPLAEILPIRRKTLSNQSINRSIFHKDILCLTEDVNSKVFPMNSTSLTPNTSCMIPYSELSSHGYSDPTTSASEYKATIMADLVEIQALSIN